MSENVGATPGELASHDPGVPKNPAALELWPLAPALPDSSEPSGVCVDEFCAALPGDDWLGAA